MGRFEVTTEDGVYEIEVADDEPSKVGPPPQPDALKTTLNAAWTGVKNLGSGVMQIGTELAEGKNPAIEMGKRMAQNRALIAPTVAGLGSAAFGLATGGLGAVASYPVFNHAAHKVNEFFGLEEPQTRRQQYEGAIADLTGSAAAEILPAVPGMVKGGYQAVRDTVFGKPHDVILQEAAPRPDIYANKLGAERTVGANETKLTQRADNYHQEFTETNPVAGVDTSSGLAAMEGLQQNLQNIKVGAVKTRSGMLDEVSRLEASKAQAATALGEAPSVGVAIEQIPLNKFDANGLPTGLDFIAKNMPGGEAAAIAAKDLLAQKFGATPAVKYPGTALEMSPARPPRKLTAIEVEDAITAFDKNIEELGGYDINMPHPTLSPSAVDSTLQAYKYVRAQLKEALQGYVGEHLGAEAATQFGKAGQQIGMANNYGMLAKRFQTETGKAFAPKAPNQEAAGNPMAGASQRVYDAATSGAPARKAQSAGLEREVAAIKDLQRLVEINQMGAPKPLPRSWNQIKASVEYSTNLGMLAVASGVLQDPSMLASMPDEIARGVVAQVATVMPQAFLPNPDNVNVIDDKFVDPMSKDIVIKQSLDLPAENRAMRIGGAFANRYMPTEPYQPPKAPPPALPATMERLNAQLGDALGMSNRYDPSNIGQLAWQPNEAVNQMAPEDLQSALSAVDAANENKLGWGLVSGSKEQLRSRLAQALALRLQSNSRKDFSQPGTDMVSQLERMTG